MSDIFWICIALVAIAAIVAGAWSKKKEWGFKILFGCGLSIGYLPSLDYCCSNNSTIKILSSELEFILSA